jgi:hypothetical protein
MPYKQPDRPPTIRRSAPAAAGDVTIALGNGRVVKLSVLGGEVVVTVGRHVPGLVRHAVTPLASVHCPRRHVAKLSRALAKLA